LSTTGTPSSGDLGVPARQRAVAASASATTWSGLRDEEVHAGVAALELVQALVQPAHDA
jgi:hypothetical protein